MVTWLNLSSNRMGEESTGYIMCEYERLAMIQRAKVREKVAEMEAELIQGFADL